MIDDVLADCMLHKAVVAGDTAFMELSRRTGEPVCVARKAGEPLELTEAEEGPLEEFTVVRAGHDCGVNGEVLLQHVADGGGSRVGGGAGGSSDGGKPAWVLATGGLEDVDGSSN
jgi:hypothetical protein